MLKREDIRVRDPFIVLDDGEVIGIGTHDELYGNCDAYREIHDLQFAQNK